MKYIPVLSLLHLLSPSNTLLHTVLPPFLMGVVLLHLKHMHSFAYPSPHLFPSTWPNHLTTLCFTTFTTPNLTSSLLDMIYLLHTLSPLTNHSIHITGIPQVIHSYFSNLTSLIFILVSSSRLPCQYCNYLLCYSVMSPFSVSFHSFLVCVNFWSCINISPYFHLGYLQLHLWIIWTAKWHCTSSFYTHRYIFWNFHLIITCIISTESRGHYQAFTSVKDSQNLYLLR